MKALELSDLVRGARVTWAWSGVAAELAQERGIRPFGHVITHDDLPTLASNLQVAIQTDDDPTWVVDPALMIAKGRKIYAAAN